MSTQPTQIEVSNEFCRACRGKGGGYDSRLFEPCFYCNGTGRQSVGISIASPAKPAGKMAATECITMKPNEFYSDLLAAKEADLHNAIAAKDYQKIQVLASICAKITAKMASAE